MNKKNSILLINYVSLLVVYGYFFFFHISIDQIYPLWLIVLLDSVLLLGGILYVIKYIIIKKYIKIKLLISLILIDVIGIICIIITPGLLFEFCWSHFGTFYDVKIHICITFFVNVIVAIPVLIYNHKIILANIYSKEKMLLMNEDRFKLEQFRDMIISRDELLNSISSKDVLDDYEMNIEAHSEHLIKLLESYINGSVNGKYILDWIEIIYWRDCYDFPDDEYLDIFVNAINEIEDILDDEKELTIEKAEKYIYALKNNVEI